MKREREIYTRPKKKKLTNAFSVSLLAGLFLIGTNASAGILPSDTTVNYYDPATGAQSSVATAIKVEIPQYDVNTYLNDNFKNLEYGHTDSYDNVITKTYKSSIGDINVKYYDQTSRHHNAFMTGSTYVGKDISEWDFIDATDSLTITEFNSNAAIRHKVWSGDSTLGTITANFVDNTLRGSKSAAGAAINNAYPITKGIIGSFINNKTSVETYSGVNAQGGAVYNINKIGYIKGDFVGNKAEQYDSERRAYERANGGAIFNEGAGNINKLEGNYIANIANARDEAYGGAIYNNKGAEISYINGAIIANGAYATAGKARGGAIYNYNSTIKNIEADFISNKAEGPKESYGGALYNQGTIENAIKGNFLDNVASTFDDHFDNNYAYGGAIYNSKYINELIGDFVRNSASGGNSNGGAIYNHSWGAAPEITNLQGNFIENYVTANEDASGGAIYNKGIIGDGSLNNSLFYKNSATGSRAYGGAIFNGGNNSGKINELTAFFVENKVTAHDSDAMGGALHNTEGGSIGTIKNDFVGNIAEGVYAVGGALTNLDGSTIENIESNFIGNKALSSAFNAETSKGGGAIANYKSSIKNINGNFIGNEVTINYGGAILNFGVDADITNITSKIFTNNKAGYGGAIANMKDAVTDHINTNFIGNESNFLGGAVFNHSRSTIKDLKGNFMDNTSRKDGGAIYNGNNSVIEKVTANFVNNTASSESYNTRGGAVYNENSDITIVNSNFANNSAVSTKQDYNDGPAEAKGGAIYNAGNATLIADNYISVFDGNKVTDANGSRNEGVFGAQDSNMTLEAKNNGTFVINDEINGEAQHNLNLKGDKSGKIYLNNKVHNANITHENIVTYTNVDNLNSPDSLNSLTMQSGILNIGSLGLNNLHLDTFGINGGDININNVQVDLAGQKMSRITADNYEQAQGGNVNVNGITLVSTTDRLITPVLFADESFKNTVRSNITKVVTPIYKYDVTYDTSNKYGEGGYFVFARGGGSGGSGGFNPAVLTAPVASQAGAQVAMNETFNYVFEHADAFTQLPVNQRMALIKSNQYAISTDYNNNLGSLAPNFNNKAGWFRPYVTFENMDLKNGPDVDITTYGSLVGFDTDFHKHRNGWNSVTTGYVGYNGSQIRHSGVDTTMNGGVLGLTETWYKGNFWTALTLSAGASVGESTTMYGKEDFTTLMAGAASKTGYNFEFKEGNFIIQPIWFMSYTFANMFDYTNAAGVKIDSDPMHTIQLHPSIRFIANTKNSWQPYASVGMVWNLMNETNVCANGVTLPQMSIKPYVEYGLGIQRLYKDNFTAFGQAMIRNGGRNGIALTAGLRWNIGKKSTETVNRGKIAKVIKQTNL